MKKQASVGIGDRFETNRDGWVVVVEYINSKKIVVMFDSGELQTVQSGALHSGRVAKPGRAAKGVDAWYKKAVSLYGDKFDISRDGYKNNDSKINVICENCGEQHRISAHRVSNMVPEFKCSCERTSYRQKFLDKASDAHSGKYLYDISTYKNSESQVVIICPYHGKFTMSAQKHIKGSGCPECDLQSRWKQKVLSKLPPDHTLLCMPNVDKKFWVRHDKCGTIYQSSLHNIDKRINWCRKCYLESIPQRITFDIFLERARVMFGDEYSYSDFKSMMDVVNIRHRVCGNTFTMKATTHLQGNYGKGVGCSHCATYGFNPSREAFLYLLKSDSGLIKIGITHQEVKRRVQQIHKRSNGHKFKEHSSWKMVGATAREMESLLHEELRITYEQPQEVFDGSTECFICSDVALVEQLVNQRLVERYPIR